MKAFFGGWNADKSRPLRRNRRRRLRTSLRALAGTWLAATMTGGPTMLVGGIAVGAPALIFTVGEPLAAAPSASCPPTGVTPAVGDSEATLSWKAPAVTVSNGDFEYYVYKGMSSGGESKTPVNASPVTGLSYKVSELTNGTTYYFTVASVYVSVALASRVNVICSGTSTEVSATPATTPASPTGLTVVPGHSQAALSWTAPAANGGSAVTGYRVYDANTADFTDGTPATTATGTSATVIGLTNGTTYYFKVTAVNAAGEGLPSGEASASLAANTVPGSPTGLTAIASGSQVTLSWTAPASDGGATITGYVIDKGTSPGREAGTAVNGSPVETTSYPVTGLTKGITYYFKVAAVNAVGQGPPSGEVSVALPSATGSGSASSSASATASPFAAPTGLTATAGNARVRLSWTAPAPDGGTPVTGYKIYRATAPGFQASAVVTSITGTSTIVTGLTNGTTYYFMVAAINAAGNETPFSAEVSATPDAAVTVTLTSGSVPKQLIAALAAIATAALAGAFTLAKRGRRPGSRPHQPVTPPPDVRAVPDTRRPGAVSVRDTGREPTHTVRFEPDHGTATTTIKERRGHD
jgi:predicted phage tail protein